MKDFQVQDLKENENFIQNKYGYCFYSFEDPIFNVPIIYNLYVHSEYRRCGHSREILNDVIYKFREHGYSGEISIIAEPQENSIPLDALIKYYKSMGLTVRQRPKRECEGNDKLQS